MSWALISNTLGFFDRSSLVPTSVGTRSSILVPFLVPFSTQLKKNTALVAPFRMVSCPFSVQNFLFDTYVPSYQDLHLTPRTT